MADKVEDPQEITLRTYRENMEWLYEGIGNLIDNGTPEVDDDTPLDELPLMMNDDSPFQNLLIKQRLKGESVYDVDTDTVDELLQKHMDEGGESFHEEFTQGKLVLCSELLQALGYNLEAARAARWGYWET